MRIARGAIVTILLLASLGIGGAPVQAAPDRPVYYLALGDSLSVGVEPDSAGVNAPRGEGYADQLHGILKTSQPGLKLVKLGCPVTETTVTMLVGDGTCDYQNGSQLGDAAAFLRKHRGSVALVTLDIGANDIEPCAVGGDIDDACVKKAFIQVAAHLPPILAALRAAAGPKVPIVGMNYYNPFLAAWFVSPALAAESTEKLAAFNGLLGAIYRFFRMPVADVAAAFHTDDGTPVPEAGGIPVNVLAICQLTYMCEPAPVGPNIHANSLGYGAIAQAFLEAMP